VQRARRVDGAGTWTTRAPGRRWSVAGARRGRLGDAGVRQARDVGAAGVRGAAHARPEERVKREPFNRWWLPGLCCVATFSCISGGPPIWRAMAAARPPRRRTPRPLPAYPRQTGSPQSCVAPWLLGLARQEIEEGNGSVK
jgi:hypothetical protein